MFRSDLLKLSVTLILLVATAFVSVAVVAAAGSDTIKLVKAASAPPTVGGAADDWFQRHPSLVTSSDAAVASDWFQRHSDSIYSSSSAVASDWFERHADSIYSSGAVAASDWFERHLSSIYLASVSAQKYGPPGR